MLSPSQPTTMDAQASFAYLSDQLPRWLSQLNDLSKYANGRSEEFAAEYETMVKQQEQQQQEEEGILGKECRGRHKRLKSASLQSLRDSANSQAARQVSPVGSRCNASSNPAEADFQQAPPQQPQQPQRKRKMPWSIRSRGSGSAALAEEARQRKRLVVHYDSHVQNELDSMVKDIGIARNSLRKARNAHQAAQGFALPSLKRKVGPSALSVLENVKSASSNNSTSSLTAPVITSSKYALLRASGSHSAEPTGSESDMKRFAWADKQLESVQHLYETAAYQFLRDGRCRRVLNQAKRHLDTLVPEAQQSLHVFQEKAAAAAAAAAAAKEREKEQKENQGDETAGSESDSAVPTNDERPLMSSFPRLGVLNNKLGPTPLSQTLEDMRKQQQLQQLQQQQQRPLQSVSGTNSKVEPGRTTLSSPSVAPAATAAAVPAAAVIEVNDDDESDDESIDALDLSQFRATNAARLSRVY